MPLEVKPGTPQTINVAGASPNQLEAMRKNIMSYIRDLSPIIESVTISNRTKTCKVEVYYEPSHIRIEVTNEEEDSKFRLTVETTTPQVPEGGSESDIPKDQ